MNYRETIDFLFNSLPMYQRTGKAAYKANLDNAIELDQLLGNPHKQFRTIHIAGTNGKGSVSHILASILSEAGYKTGLYTSPHLLDFRERIRVNGEMIDRQEVVRFVADHHEAITRISPSFFEMTFAMALDHFAHAGIDFGIIETGMGGRLDSTNIITPIASVITNISLDHMEFLGSTTELIAAEKGGIIKEKVPVVLGTNSEPVTNVIRKIAASKKSRLILAGEEREFSFQTQTTDHSSVFHFRNLKSNRVEQIKCDLNGKYQHENISVVMSAVELLENLGVSISAEALTSGLSKVRKNTSLRGRWEITGANPRVICDTAHNEAGVAAISDQLKHTPYRKLHIVWGMVGDKTADKILRLLPGEALYYYTQPTIPRALPTEKLAEAAEAAGRAGTSFPEVESAYQAARKAADIKDTIFIGGSTFLVADYLAAIQKG